MQVDFKDFKVGDLVQLKHYCRDRDRPAIIIDTDGPWTDYCQIVFADTNELVNANKSNLELVSASR